MAAAVETQTDDRMGGGPGRSFWVLICAVGLLLVAGVALALVVTQPNEASYPPNSPEGTVQRYVRFLQNGQVDRAYTMTDLELTRQEFDDQFDSWNQTSHRVTLVRTYRSGSEAAVTVDVSTFSGGVYAASDMSERTTFTLERHGVEWRIAGPDYLPY